MEDTGTPAKRKTRGRKTYKLSLNLDNPIENHIHSYIEQYGKGNASGNIKRMLMEYISWDKIMSYSPPEKGEFPFRGKPGYSGKSMDRPSSNDKKMAEKIFGY
jgi:hypothetical protein